MWREKIDRAVDVTEVNGVIGWHVLKTPLRPSDPSSDGLPVLDTLQQAQLFRDETLGRFSATDDTAPEDLNAWSEEECSVPWDGENSR